jgi:hypothetical protein
MVLLYTLVNLVFAVRGTSDGPTIRETIYQGLAVTAGALFSLVYYVPTYRTFGREDFVRGITRASAEDIGLKISGVGAGKGYALVDFIWAPASSRINQPTGIGIVLFLVLCAGLVLFFARWHQTKQSRWRITALAWLVFAVLGVLAEYLPVSLFPHRFWVVLAIPVAMIAGEFLGRFAGGLGARYTVLALVLGAALGATLALFGLGEALYGMGHVPLEGERLAAALLAALTLFAALVAGLYVLIQESVPPGRCALFAGLAVITAGIALTSAFAKARFEGFAPWDCGRRFYRRIAPGEDGSPVILQNDLFGYTRVRRSLPPNTPVMGLTCSEDRIIGFDMFTPPLDEELRLFRRQMEALPLERIDNETVARIHAAVSNRKFEFVTVDHYWASFPMRINMSAARTIKDLMLQSGIDNARLSDLIQGRMEPTPLEENIVKVLKEAMERQRAAAAEEEEQVRKVARLKDALEKSPLFKKEYDSGPYGMALFKVNYPEEAPKPEP